MKWILLTILPFLVTVTLAGEIHWKLKRKHHKFKSLALKKMEKLATLSDPYRMYKFDYELNPLLIERVPDTTGHRIVQDKIKERLGDLDWHIMTDRFLADTPERRKNFTNIVATQNPNSLRRLVIACHYDSKLFKHAQFIGATDSAVPCAMMLDMARSMDYIFKKRDEEGTPEISLQLIFFDGEEAFHQWSDYDSLYGSRHLADEFEKIAHPKDNSDNTNLLHSIDALILLDLIGGRNPKFRNWFEETEKVFERFSKIERKLREKGHLSREGPYFVRDKMYQTARFIEDDHIPFLKKQVPVLHMIAYPFPDVWHTPYDTKSNLDYDSIDDLNKILRIFVAEYLHLNAYV